MPMPEDQRVARITATKEAAAALLEDLQHMREVLARDEHDRGEVRRMSALLRRIVLDGDLPAVAAPRMGRLTLTAPDNKPVYKAEKLGPYPLFQSGGAQVFGVWMRAAMVDRAASARELEGFDPERTVELNIDSFLSQRVVCIEGRWITRKSVIKFAANVASGVHSGSPTDDDEQAIARLRRSVSYSLKGQAAGISFDPGALTVSDAEFSYSPDNLDPVLVELLAAALFLTTSPGVVALEAAIRSEFGLTP